MSRNFIDSSFAESAKQMLESSIPPNSFDTITRKALCQKMEMAECDGDIFSKMLRLDLLPEFESRGGNGIGRKNVEKPKPSAKFGGQEFADKVIETLKEHIKTRQHAMTRRQLAEAMGIPGGDTETAISAVFKDKLIVGYKLARKSGITLA